jgi:DNA-binding response OmpR family regulator
MSSNEEGHANAESTGAFRVLVVDDEHEVCEAVVALLKSRGHDAVGADSGAAALDRLQREYFDVLLCDVRMPGMSGLDLVTKALDIVPGMPVIILSGASDVSTARDALHRGAMDYLVKPVELDELDRVVQAAARRRRTLATPPVVSTENVELRGGPLDQRRVRIDDSRFRLWVIQGPGGQQVLPAIEQPTALGAGRTILGAYGYSSADNVMHWVPAGA